MIFTAVQSRLNYYNVLILGVMMILGPQIAAATKHTASLTLTVNILHITVMVIWLALIIKIIVIY